MSHEITNVVGPKLSSAISIEGLFRHEVICHKARGMLEDDRSWIHKDGATLSLSNTVIVVATSTMVQTVDWGARISTRRAITSQCCVVNCSQKHHCCQTYKRIISWLFLDSILDGLILTYSTANYCQDHL